MADLKVYLDGYIQVPLKQLDAAIAALPDHIALSRAEPGCLSFDVTVSPDIPGRFLVSEVYRNQSAFEAHQARTRESHWFSVTAVAERNYAIRTETRGDEAEN